MQNTENKVIKNPLADEYRPLFFRLNIEKDKAEYEKLLNQNKNIAVYDTIYLQLSELAKVNNPALKLSKQEIDDVIKTYLGENSIESYGVWVYYPWSDRLVHILDENEFIKVRTARNIYKITPDEIQTLRTKKIGIIGLSVGQVIALTIATERICGSIHLADFDDIELSNMNRLTVGVHDLGSSKVILAARKIAELDPYIKVTCFKEGITVDNIDDFFTLDGNIDVLVEECDGIDIKILSRLKAKEYGVPVVMDTNDRGMLDIERFDLNPQMPIFYGKVDENISLKNLKELTNQEKLPLLDAMVGIATVSDKMKFSLSELGKTISTWPQLASSVVLGGAMVTDTCRRILLGEINQSGRYYIDFEQLIK